MALQGKGLVTKPEDPSATGSWSPWRKKRTEPHKVPSDLRPDNMVYMDTHRMNKYILFICFVLLGI